MAGLLHTRSTIRTAARAVRDFVLPAFCIACGNPSDDGSQAFFCRACWTAWPAILGPACARCAKPLAPRVGYPLEPNYVCRRCVRAAPAIGRTWAAAEYSGTASVAIRAFKFARWEALGTLLGPLLAQTAERKVSLGGYDAIIPVPLHWRRAWWRGFNQAAILAGYVEQSNEAPPLTPLLIRSKYTTPQARLAVKERKRNLRGAFAIRRGYPIARRRFLLVDDVTTSGATLDECARTLRDAGADTVDALVLAVRGSIDK